MTQPLNIKLQNEIIRLRKDGLSYSAICKQLHLTRGQIAGVLYRARQRDKANPPPFCCVNCGTLLFPGSHIVQGNGCDACKPLIYQKAS